MSSFKVLQGLVALLNEEGKVIFHKHDDDAPPDVSLRCYWCEEGVPRADTIYRYLVHPDLDRNDPEQRVAYVGVQHARKTVHEAWLENLPRGSEKRSE